MLTWSNELREYSELRYTTFQARLAYIIITPPPEVSPGRRVNFLAKPRNRLKNILITRGWLYKSGGLVSMDRLRRRQSCSERIEVSRTVTGSQGLGGARFIAQMPSFFDVSLSVELQDRRRCFVHQQRGSVRRAKWRGFL